MPSSKEASKGEKGQVAGATREAGRMAEVDRQEEWRSEIDLAAMIRGASNKTYTKEHMLELINQWEFNPHGIKVDDRLTYQEIHLIFVQLISWLMSDGPVELPLQQRAPRADVMQGMGSLNIPVLDAISIDLGLGNLACRNKAERLLHLRMYLEDFQARPMPQGRHKGLSPLQLQETDPGYLNWAVDTLQKWEDEGKPEQARGQPLNIPNRYLRTLATWWRIKNRYYQNPEPRRKAPNLTPIPTVGPIWEEIHRVASETPWPDDEPTEADAQRPFVRRAKASQPKATAGMAEAAGRAYEENLRQNVRNWTPGQPRTCNGVTFTPAPYPAAAKKAPPPVYKGPPAVPKMANFPKGAPVNPQQQHDISSARSSVSGEFVKVPDDGDADLFQDLEVPSQPIWTGLAEDLPQYMSLLTAWSEQYGKHAPMQTDQTTGKKARASNEPPVEQKQFPADPDKDSTPEEWARFHRERKARRDKWRREEAIPEGAYESEEDM